MPPEAPLPNPDPVAAFIDHWSKAPASERATSQSFLNDLCDLLGVPRPDNSEAYQFERPVPSVQPGGKRTTKFIDLYKRGCFILEAKKYDERKAEADELALLVEELPASKKNKVVRGTERWDDAMIRAFGQAERYAHHLPSEEPTPLFLVVVDVGHVIELYADFSQKGRNFIAFPDSRSHRILLAGLADPQIRERLRLVWVDPSQLDPSKRTTEVTLTVARHLAALASSLEKAGHPPKLVAEFLCRCLFCMFAEDVGLIAKNSFKGFLESMRGDPGAFVPLMGALFMEMDRGASVSMLLRQKLLRFNGGLFAEQTVLPVNGTQLGLLIEAAKCEWRYVEPAIFGTLLEQALTDTERGRLGAHFTPRAYVERLVLPTVIEPLRADWRAVRDEAVILANRGDLKLAREKVCTFHDKLCAIRVLDPACGSGNFLYVTLEHMKRLEGEALDLLRQFGDTATPAATVDPHQFLGLELNGRAVPIAELVLWIGYLQWHFRVHGNVLPAEPVLKKFDNIIELDAVLAYDRRIQVTGKMAAANPELPGLPDNWREKVAEHTDVIFIWDRRSFKTDGATGREVPDVTKQILERLGGALTPAGSEAEAAGEAEQERYGAGQLVRPRLGQGAFRVLVTDAYSRRCAMTGERTLPALEAAHIQRYSDNGPHRVDNGLLLRSDLHHLFDLGYLTVTSDYRIEVSRRIKEEYENGRDYYALHGRELKVLPSAKEDRPSQVFLDWHRTTLFEMKRDPNQG